MILQRFSVVTTVVMLFCSCFSIANSMPKKSKHSALLTRRGLVNDVINSNKKENIINVDHFGAKADGRNDANAFMEAWSQACKTPHSVLLVPANKTYLLNPPIRFLGPCMPGFIMRKDPRVWVVFDQVKNFTLDGGGTFDGNGHVWWEASCKVNNGPNCRSEIPPKAVMFNESSELRVTNIRFLNAQQMHLTFGFCNGVDASNLLVIAPETSPNTDGIHVLSTEHMNIENCIISTGDDCLSIINGSTNIRVHNIRCGPGHGISIGSLGKNRSIDVVSDIHINNVTLTRTDNGLRIKSWQGGRGHAHNIRFENVRMINVTNPIIIDQNYCDQEEPCHQQVAIVQSNKTFVMTWMQNDAVKIDNIVYKDITGTSATDLAIKFDCSKTVPCQDIQVQNVHLFPQGGGGVKNFCANAKLKVEGNFFPGLQCT